MKHICHVSLLNPVNHPRIYEKYAKSQLKSGYKLSICAKSIDHFHDPAIQIISHPDFNRLSIFRIWYNFLLLFKLSKIKADIYFIHSPELLWLACFFKIFTKSKWIYDVHEKYEDNVIYHRGWPFGIKTLLAWTIKSWEKICTQYFLDAVIYAEKGFKNHLHAKVYFVLPNGIEEYNPKNQLNIENSYVLLSGNISENWGSLEAIHFYNTYFSQNYDLVIIGKCPDKIENDKLLQKVSQSSFKNKIKLIGLNQYVAHHEILEWTSRASFLFCLYPNNPAIQNRIPTKMMEAWYFQTPIIFSPLEEWKILNEKYHFGFSTDEMTNISSSFYDQKIPESEFLWEKMYEYYEFWFIKQFLK